MIIYKDQTTLCHGSFVLSIINFPETSAKCLIFLYLVFSWCSLGSSLVLMSLVAGGWVLILPTKASWWRNPALLHNNINLQSYSCCWAPAASKVCQMKKRQSSAISFGWQLLSTTQASLRLHTHNPYNIKFYLWVASLEISGDSLICWLQACTAKRNQKN